MTATVLKVPQLLEIKHYDPATSLLSGRSVNNAGDRQLRLRAWLFLPQSFFSFERPIGITLHKKDLGATGESVNDRVSYGIVSKYLVALSERQVGGGSSV